ncbi:MAG: alpha/beta fold hydrolase [Blastocatellia bacterium]|nr:alpha/beta fold hydrolase [Blastocatellia bacterium]MBK6425641.1 alpha/beta fold hydrolase [Blastocatellia bacterium]
MDSRTRYYDFGSFRLDAQERVLTRDGENVALTPKAFDTLAFFVRSAGRILEKDVLLEAIWPDAFVEEANLAVNVSLVRKALGERSDGGQYIETVPRRGYRFADKVRLYDVNGIAISGPEPLSPVGAVAPPRTDDGSRVKIIRRPPEIRYAQSADVNIAYQVVGDGPIDVVFVMGWVSHLEYYWKNLDFARFLSRLAAFSRLILFDKRGTGLSDRVSLGELPTLEQRMDDVRAVMDAVGSTQAALIGVSEGGPMSALFAATYPEKTVALVMIGTYAKRLRDKDYPWGPTLEQREAFLQMLQRDWGGPVGIEERAPSRAEDPDFRQWWAAYLRMGASPAAAVALTRMNAEIDVRNILRSVRVPTLVLHRTGDTCLRVEEGRFVAERIPGAKFVELPGADHLPFVGDQDAILDEIEEFLTGARHAPDLDRVLATVLVAVIDSVPTPSPESAASGGRGMLYRFVSHVGREIQLFRGSAAEVLDSRITATFDGPARAIRCACAIRDVARRLGVDVRAGLHTGECEIRASTAGGLAVDVGSQVAKLAGPGEVLVTSTVKDIVAGSGIEFEDRGTANFAGMGDVRLFAVTRYA